MAKQSQPDILAKFKRWQELKNIQDFDKEKYRVNLWMMFVTADLLQTSMLDLQELMKSIGVYYFEDKRKIETITKLISSFVSDVDKQCTEDFALEFGSICDESHELLRSFLENKRIPVDEKHNL